MSTEIRQNKATGQWVIYAPNRGNRPDQFSNDTHQSSDLPEYDPECPFCKGNENQIPEIILALPTRDNWQTRVVPNKFPALTLEADIKEKSNQIHRKMGGFGRHEVIIEHPQHNLSIADMNDGEVQTIIETYYRRYVALLSEYPDMAITIFRNHGDAAGTSIQHPHSQLVMSPIVTREKLWGELEALRYYNEHHSNIYMDMLEAELDAGTRVIAENLAFVAFVPYAAQVPYEMWIVPRRQQANFSMISDDEKVYLAQILRQLLANLRAKLGNPAYNIIIQTGHHREETPHLQWYVQIRPRVTTPAGFEIGSGILINPSLPEDDATHLCEFCYKK